MKIRRFEVVGAMLTVDPGLVVETGLVAWEDVIISRFWCRYLAF